MRSSRRKCIEIGHNRSARALAMTFAFAFFFAIPAAKAATYYVATTGNDAASGAIGTPFLTIKKGVSVLRPGDTLYIRGGMYTNYLSQRINSADMAVSGGSSYSDAPVISGYPNETVVINGSNGAGIWFTAGGNKSYWIIQDITMDGSNWGPDSGAQLVYIERGNHHIRLQRMRLLNAEAHTVLANGDYLELLNSYIDTNNRLNLGPQIGNGWYGAGSHQLVEGNEFVNMRGGGVRFFDSDLTHVVTGSIARKNRIHEFSQNGPADGFGILLGGVNNQAYDNVVYNGAGPGIQVMYGQSNSGNGVYNNTIYKVSSYGIMIYPGSGNTPSGTIVKNNIIFSNAVDIGNSGSGTILSNNLTSDPLFVNAAAGDFRVQTLSRAIDAGTSITDVSDDIDGTARPSGSAFDIGAYEGLGLRPPANVKVQ